MLNANGSPEAITWVLANLGEEILHRLMVFLNVVSLFSIAIL